MLLLNHEDLVALMDNKKILNVTEAAIYLGVTKELLFAYIRNAPKKHLGNDRKLPTIERQGQNYFYEEDLIDFDNFIKEPWSNPGDARPAIPTYIKEYLKVEIGGKCPITAKGYPLEDAHIVPYNLSLNHHHHNLLRVAKDEHTKADNGVIPREILLETKNRLVEQLRYRLQQEAKGDQLHSHVPKPHPIFIGRLEQLLNLTDAMEFERLVIVEGIGGIGKTQLLLHGLANVQYHNPVVWIDIEAVDNLSDLYVLLNNASSAYTGNSSSESLYDSLKDIPITFVFDSLEKLLLTERDETENFIHNLLTETRQVQLLATSQVDISILDHPKKIIKLKGLETEETICLILELLEDEIELSQEHLYWIVEFCNGHPLSIKLIVSLIKYFRSSERAVVLLKRNSDLKHPIKKHHDKLTSLAVCLSTVYDNLTERQKQFLHFLKFFPAGLKLEWAEKKIEDEIFIYDIASLQHFFFIESMQDRLDFERIVVPNPIRPFLKEKAKQNDTRAESETEKDAIVHIMMEAAIIDLHYIESGLHGPPSYGILRIEDEMPNLLHAFQIAQDKANYYEEVSNIKLRDEYLHIVTGISSALGKFCFTRSYHRQGFLFADAGIKAYKLLHEYSLAASQYMYLAQIQSRLFDLSGLETTVNNLEHLAAETKEEAVNLNFLWAKGILNFDKAHYEEARKYFKEALFIMQKNIQEFVFEKPQNVDEEIFEVGKKNEVGNALILKFNIAKTYEFQEKYLEAIPLHRETILELEKYYLPEEIGSNYHHLAHCLCKNKNYKEGFDFYYKAIDSFSEVGQFEYLANSISDLGLFIEEFPKVINNSLFNGSVFAKALGSITNQVLSLPDARNLLKSDPDLLPFNLLSKIILIVKSVGFSSHRIELTRWVSDFIEELPISFSKPNLLGCTLNLAYCIGGIDEWNKDELIKKKVLASILKSCLIINGGPDLKSKTRIFFWLSKWLQVTGLEPDASPEDLWKQAWESFEE
jgi:tetratricopeptide (TPR) repeat protein